ncbi:MAG: tetraacyldisaccharide 4'-kinase [Saprospiraceae bacterium]|nr:tetraacyldisaccharide 4'-kinase [Saprospiraceae bacterium]
MFRKLVIRILLSPFSLIYGVLISLRNGFYDFGILRSSRFSVPVISVGNLTIGGAGKSPHIEFLTAMLKDYINVAILSRGYKRQTKGFRFVAQTDNAYQSGDEPLQFKRKFRDEIVVAVSESRAFGIPQILQQYPDVQTILLDDAFQHREVQPGLNILLTAYENLFTRDYLLPAGRLREWRSAYKRADIIIVSKCPGEMDFVEKEKLFKEINPLENQKIFFSYYEYGYPYNFFNPSQRINLDEKLDVVLLSSIANTDYLLDFLEKKVESIHEVEFADHHNYELNDIEFITKVYKNRTTERKILLTTEKDATRLELHKNVLLEKQIPIFILPVKVVFHFGESESFKELIQKYLLQFKA